MLVGLGKGGGTGLEGADLGWQQQTSELLFSPVPAAPSWGLAGFTASAAFFQT